MQDSATVGSPPTSRAEPLRRRARAYRSLVVKTVLLAVIFFVVPLILYSQFKAADEEKQNLLLRSVREQGRLLGQALLPLLEKGGDHPALPQLGHELERFADNITNVKLLFAPPGGGFFYIASWPVVPAAQLDIEREKLRQQGVLSKLSATCEGQFPVAFRYSTPKGDDEVVTSVTPLSTTAGCWILVTSFPAGVLPGARLGEPYWATPEVKFAAAIYLAMVLLTLTTFLRVRRGLNHFAERARAIRDEGPSAGPFGAHNEIPELDAVAQEFDRMVEVLHSSADDIRRAAEDNAHAFKTPIAVIRQSLEPLKRGVAAENQRGARAVGLIESSLDKLDGLVASARRLGEATADLIDTRRTDVDLSSLLHRLLHAHADTFGQRRIVLKGRIAPGVVAFANEEMVETVIENVLDNAISFSPDDSEIGVRLEAAGDVVVFLIGDSGPGVPEEDLTRIFGRYFSQRPRQAPSDDAPVTHFGIGLWIARRNVEALGGTIRAENRAPHGLLLRIELPRGETGRAVAGPPKSAIRLS